MSALMETMTLGESDLTVPRLGFGCWQLGGNGWQNIDQCAITAAIHLALEKDIYFFDTADIYGLGMSESLLGKALAENTAGKRAVVTTKFGVRIEDGKKWYDNSTEWMHEALHASLKRLKRDAVDLYLMHWHDGERPIHDIFADLEALRDAGKIRWYGLSNLPLSDIPRPYPPGFISYSVEYNLVRRRPQEEERRLEKEKRPSLIAWGGLAQGLLTGKYDKKSQFAASDIRSRNTHIFVDRYWPVYDRLLQVLKNAADAYDRSMSQTALRWILDSQPASCALTGIQDPSQLTENLGALNWRLDEEWKNKLTAASLACHRALATL